MNPDSVSENSSVRFELFVKNLTMWLWSGTNFFLEKWKNDFLAEKAPYMKIEKVKHSFS